MGVCSWRFPPVHSQSIYHGFHCKGTYRVRRKDLLGEPNEGENFGIYEGVV